MEARRKLNHILKGKKNRFLYPLVIFFKNKGQTYRKKVKELGSNASLYSKC